MTEYVVIKTQMVRKNLSRDEAITEALSYRSSGFGAEVFTIEEAYARLQSMQDLTVEFPDYPWSR